MATLNHPRPCPNCRVGQLRPVDAPVKKAPARYEHGGVRAPLMREPPGMAPLRILRCDVCGYSEERAGGGR